MAKSPLNFQPARRHLVLLVLSAIAVYVLLPQLGDFRSSWHLLRHPSPSFSLLAVALVFATFLAAAGTYCLLAFRRLAYGLTVVEQLAATFINRLLPAGIGALGANYLYLRHERHSAAQAGSIVAINNLLGLLGHSLLLALALTLFHDRSLPSQHFSSEFEVVWKVAVLVAAVALIAGLLFGRRRLVRLLGDVRQQLLSYRRRPQALLFALGTSLLLSVCNILALAACTHALGVQLPFTAVVLVFTLGLSAGAAVPTPGGLGGFEAGLAAGFVAYGVDPALALATALLFRLISYWLPLVTGAVAFVFCQDRRLFET